MDGSVGSHSAALHRPYADTGKTAPCYYTAEQVEQMVSRADREGFQLSSHAIGGAAIDLLVSALDKLQTNTLHRIEHCEFPTGEGAQRLKAGKYALVMQPGYAWIDKRCLHTYRENLPEEVLADMKFGSFYRSGVCLCGSSDSPVQDLDPWLQMQGMVQFYQEAESVTPFEAFRCYTANGARAIGEEDLRGTLEPGKAADFFTADRDLFAMNTEEILSFRPEQTWYAGKPCRPKKGTVPELLSMLLTRPKKI